MFDMYKKVSPEVKTYREKLEGILDETVAFYSRDTSKRSVDKYTGRCLYRSVDGRACAVGRYLPDDIARKMDDGYMTYSPGNSITILWPVVLELETFKDTRVDFWVSLQNLHDRREYWGDDLGITEAGRSRVDYIRQSIRTGEFDL